MPGQTFAICQHFAFSQKMFYRFLLLATHIRQALLKLSMILFQPFVPARPSLRHCFLVLDFVSAIIYSFHAVFEISRFAFISPGILLSGSPQRISLSLPLLLSMLISSLFQSFLHPGRCNLLQNLSPSPLHALM